MSCLNVLSLLSCVFFLNVDIGSSTPFPKFGGFGSLKGKHGGMHPKNDSNTTYNHHKLVVWFDNTCAKNKKQVKVSCVYFILYFFSLFVLYFIFV